MNRAFRVLAAATWRYTTHEKSPQRMMYVAGQHTGRCVPANLRCWIFGRCVRRLGSRCFRKLCLRRLWLGWLLLGGLLLLLFLRWFLDLLHLIVVRHYKHSCFSPETEKTDDYAEYDVSRWSWSVRYVTFHVIATGNGRNGNGLWHVRSERRVTAPFTPR